MFGVFTGVVVFVREREVGLVDGSGEALHGEAGAEHGRQGEQEVPLEELNLTSR